MRHIKYHGINLIFNLTTISSVLESAQLKKWPFRMFRIPVPNPFHERTQNSHATHQKTWNNLMLSKLQTQFQIFSDLLDQFGISAGVRKPKVIFPNWFDFSPGNVRTESKRQKINKTKKTKPKLTYKLNQGKIEQKS
uniref:(northern house mosquito) hypothetical protein n=1 Tax=Culex pipiens TaxID=7175 RepID=A0A8D8JHF8_CULPI